MSTEDEIEERAESDPPPNEVPPKEDTPRDLRSAVLLAGALGLVTLFWMTAVAADLFVDHPFAYVFSSGWVQNLAASSARFPGKEESGRYFVSCVLLVPALVLGALWAARRFGDPLERLSRAIPAKTRQIALVFGVVAAAGAAFVAFGLVQGASIIDDERAYLFQAETFAKGHLVWPAMPDAFRNAMFLTKPVWTAKYPPGHALALLPGVVLGVPHAVPFLLTALNVLGVYQLARGFGERQAVLATALFALSPFVWAMGGTLLAFSTSTCALTWFFAALARSRHVSGWKWPALGGVALGFAAVTRPFDAIALGLPLMLWLTWRAFRRMPGAVRELVLVGAAALPFVAFQLWYNRSLTGDPLTFPYFESSGYRLGFMQKLDWFPYVHDPLQAAGHLAVAGMRLDSWLLAFPGGLLLCLVGALRPDAGAWDRLLVASVGSFALFFTLVPGSGTWDVGPTYYYSCAPLLVILAVRGVHAVRTLAAERWPEVSALASSLVVTGSVIALVCIAPLHFVRLTLLAAEIRAPWEAVGRSGIGNAIVTVPTYGKRFAAGYALGYPYEIPTGPSTRAHLVWPKDAAELAEARTVIGAELPVYRLVADRELFEQRGRRRFQLVPLESQ